MHLLPACLALAQELRSQATDRPRIGRNRYAAYGSAFQAAGPGRLRPSRPPQPGWIPEPETRHDLSEWAQHVAQQGTVTEYYDRPLRTVYQRPGHLIAQDPWILRWHDDLSTEFTLAALGLEDLARRPKDRGAWTISASLSLLYQLPAAALWSDDQEVTAKQLTSQRFGDHPEWNWSDLLLAPDQESWIPASAEQRWLQAQSVDQEHPPQEGRPIYASLYLATRSPEASLDPPGHQCWRVRTWCEPLRVSHLTGHWIGAELSRLVQASLLPEQVSPADKRRGQIYR